MLSQLLDVGSCVTQHRGGSRPALPAGLRDPGPHTIREPDALCPTGSAADLCKMAMIRIFAAVATSPTLTARSVREQPACPGPGPAPAPASPRAAAGGLLFWGCLCAHTSRKRSHPSHFPP